MSVVSDLRSERRQLRKQLERVREAERQVGELGGACLAQLAVAVDLLAALTGKTRDEVAAALSTACGSVSSSAGSGGFSRYRPPAGRTSNVLPDKDNSWSEKPRIGGRT